MTVILLPYLPYNRTNIKILLKRLSIRGATNDYRNTLSNN